MSLLDPANALRKVGSAGKPPLFVDIRIVRPDGTACEPNETGELLVSGPNVMAGYWDRADATGDAFARGRTTLSSRRASLWLVSEWALDHSPWVITRERWAELCAQRMR